MECACPSQNLISDVLLCFLIPFSEIVSFVSYQKELFQYFVKSKWQIWICFHFICMLLLCLCLFGIMSLLRHSILWQSLLRHSILRQSLLRLLILRQWPIVFAILALLTIQMQYGTAHLTWKKRHGFYPGVGSFFSHAALLFLKLFSAAQQNIFLQKKILFHVDLIKLLSVISLFIRFPSYFPQNSG